MDEILKIHREYFRHLPWRSIVRCLAVILGILLLAVSAGFCSDQYLKTILAEYNGNYVSARVISSSIPGTASSFTEMNVRSFPAGKIDFPEISPSFKKTDMTDNQKPSGITEAKDLSSTAIPHKTADTPVISNAAIHDTAAFSLQDTSGGISGGTDDTISTAASLPLDNIFTGSDDGTLSESVPASITISAYGNGGIPETTEISVNADTFTMDMLETPVKLGKLFVGWYLDPECTIPFSETDIASGIENRIGCLPLYAGWTEFPGFLSNDLGYITCYTDVPETVIDGFLPIPGYETCTGIAKGAFDNVADCIFELYIPDNIIFIEEGAFDNLYNLMYIEVSAGNPVYCSEKGILYYHDGTEAAYPEGRRLLLGEM